MLGADKQTDSLLHCGAIHDLTALLREAATIKSDVVAQGIDNALPWAEFARLPRLSGRNGFRRIARLVMMDLLAARQNCTSSRSGFILLEEFQQIEAMPNDSSGSCK